MTKTAENTQDLFQLPQQAYAVPLKGQNDIVRDPSGRTHLDLSMGHGAVFLGHANEAVASYVHAQLDRLWTPCQVQQEIIEAAKEKAERLLPRDYRLVHFYSTGTEAVEAALRMAHFVTGKPELVGFQGSTHGKSFATAGLGWANQFNQNNIFIRIPSISDAAEEQVLSSLEKALKKGNTAAVVVEPIQCAKNGKLASPGFYLSVSKLCRDHENFLIVDEVLTGCYRTGKAFLYPQLGLDPDILIAGKSLGNGFPVSAVFSKNDCPISAAMHLNSTYSDNPLAAAAVYGTLAEMEKLNLPEKVLSIERIIREELLHTEWNGVQLRGLGALWILEFSPQFPVKKLSAALFDEGLLLSSTDSVIRLLPAATVLPENLRRACRLIQEQISRFQSTE